MMRLFVATVIASALLPLAARGMGKLRNSNTLPNHTYVCVPYCRPN